MRGTSSGPDTLSTGPGAASRITRSMLANTAATGAPDEVRHWLSRHNRLAPMLVEQIPLDELAGWATHPDSGTLAHLSGRFFAVDGLTVEVAQGPIRRWSQPIINQPEVGILGLLVKEIDGVLHCLMQAKTEPGNHNGAQLAPTLQATRSNYTRVHRGRPVPYLSHFRTLGRARVLTDVRQSEQGAWFWQKRNRNMVVETTEDVPVADGFRWLTLGQVYELLAADDVVNMDVRTVLACLPFAGPDVPAAFAGPDVPAAFADPPDQFGTALIRSYAPGDGGLHGTGEILNWLTESRCRLEVRARLAGLGDLARWRRSDGVISHDTGAFFDIIGVRVRAAGREVDRWTQPMLRPKGIGVVAFLAARIRGVLHVLVRARPEPGHLDMVELAPTVQCVPENYDSLPPTARPRFLDEVLAARPDQIRFASVLAEEGGRLYHARNRYLVVEVEAGPEWEGDDFRWMTLRQLTALLRHSYYLNVQARSLVACLHSLCLRPPTSEVVEHRQQRLDDPVLHRLGQGGVHREGEDLIGQRLGDRQ